MTPPTESGSNRGESTQALELRHGSVRGAARTDAGARVMPHSLDAERSVLGAILLAPEALQQVLESLEPADFYREPHRIIFEAMLGLLDSHGSVDLMLLTEQLRDGGSLKKVGGVEYLAKLAQSVPIAADLPAHVRLVKAKSIMRHVI